MSAPQPDGDMSPVVAAYGARILAARTGTEMNNVAAEIANDDTVSVSSRRTLQLLFGNCVRDLWPQSFKRRSY